MKDSYSKQQLDSLCTDLEEKATEAYEKQGKKFDSTKTTPNNYSILVSEICETNVKCDIKEEWLRDLFTKKRYELSSILMVELVDYCCRYINGKSVNEYFGNINESVERCHSTYKVFWKGTTRGGEQVPVTYEYNLILTRNSSSFNPIKDESKTSYGGKTPSICEGNVYVELKHPNNIEKVYMIFHIGIAERESLQLLSGLFLAVDTAPHPCSGPIFLVREDVVNIPIDVVNEYFNRYKESTLIKSKTIDKLKIMAEDLQKRIPHSKESLNEKRLKGLVGNWYIYTKTRKAGEVDRAKIAIDLKNSIAFESIYNTYSEGKIDIVGTTNVVIQLANSSRSAAVVIEIGHIVKVENLQIFPCLYLSTGRLRPVCGIAILERTSKNFEEMEIKIINEKRHANEYKELEFNGIIEMLDKADNIYLSHDL